jgi:hypothetical protein
MSDIADDADKRITDTIEDAIARARRNLSARMRPTGICHWCECNTVEDGHVFCSSECHQDWEHEKQRRLAMGL